MRASRLEPDRVSACLRRSFAFDSFALTRASLLARTERIRVPAIAFSRATVHLLEPQTSAGGSAPRTRRSLPRRTWNKALAPAVLCLRLTAWEARFQPDAS